MGHIYRIWFQWGFITYAVGLGLSLFVRCSGSGLNAFGAFRDTLLGCLGVSLCLNSLAFIGLGLMWRFSESGNVVSGERLIRPKELASDEKVWKEYLDEAAYERGYQIQGGNVMKTYFFFVLPIMVGTVLILSVVGMLLKPDGGAINWGDFEAGNDEEKKPLMQDDLEKCKGG